jgi:CRISPR/Cas system-associated endoribonuclease Cas2
MMNSVRSLTTLLLFFFIFFPLFGQKSLEKLLDERDTLYGKQEVLASRNSTFWGTQSKRDLRKMVENLEEILRKDNEIIAAIKRDNFASRTNIIYKNRDTRNKKTELQGEVNRYKRLHNQKSKELKAALEELNLAQSRKFNYELVILVFFLTITVLLFFIRRLYSKLK